MERRTRREVLAAIAGATTLAGCGGQQAQPKQDKTQEDTPSTPSTPVYDRFIEDLKYTFPNIVDATNNSVSIAFYPDRRARFKEEARKDLRLEFYIQFPFTEGGFVEYTEGDMRDNDSEFQTYSVETKKPPDSFGTKVAEREVPEGSPLPSKVDIDLEQDLETRFFRFRIDHIIKDPPEYVDEKRRSLMYTPGYSYFNLDFIKNSEEVVAGAPNAKNRRYNVSRVDHEEEKFPLNLSRYGGAYAGKELNYNNEPLKFGYTSTKLCSLCLMEDNTFKCASQIPFDSDLINDEIYENSYRSQINIRWSISPETFYQQRLMFMNDELEGRIPRNEYEEHARTVYASHNYTPDDVLKTGDKILNQIRTQLKRKFGEANPVYMLKALTRFVKNIPYVYDSNSREFIEKYLGELFYDGLIPNRMLQPVHLPDVTLAVGGDCEDLALLLYYLLQKSEYEYQPAMVWRKLPNGRLFGFNNPSKSEGGVAWYNHVGVAIPLKGEFENYFDEEYIDSDESYKYTFEQYGQRFIYLETTNQELIGSAEVEAGENVEIMYWPQQDEKIEYPDHELFAEDDPMFSRPDESDPKDDSEESN